MVLLGGALRRRTLLSETQGTSIPPKLPFVSVVIAAKDEEANIETCVRSLMAQDYPSFEVIVANDRSRDGTAAILERLAVEFPRRLKVVTIDTLEEGWFGKCHAMRAAVRASKSDGVWLLMSDADCRFISPQAIRRGVEEALASNADFLTIIPQLDAPTWWERLIQPICALVLVYWFQPDQVNDPRKRVAYANGAYMLMNRMCYEGIGGHAAVRDQLNEDIQLARLAKGGGWRLRVVENDNLYRTRMYATRGLAWRGWSRIFCGALRSPLKSGLAVVLVFTFALLPSLSMIAAFAWENVAPAGRWIWGLAFLMEQLVVWRLYGMMKVGRAWSLLYPIAAAVMVGILFNAFLAAVGATSTTWRTTTYRRGKTVPAATA